MGVNRLRLRSLAEGGDRSAKIAEHLLQNSGKLLSGILLGNNFANVMLASLSTALAVPLWGQAAVLYVPPILTVLLLVFAEILPKTLAAKKSIWLTRLTARPLALFLRMTGPFIWMTSKAAALMLSPFLAKGGSSDEDAVRPEDLIALAKAGDEAGTLSHVTQNILHGAYEFSVSSVVDVMVPRHEIMAIPLDAGIEGFKELVARIGHTRIPVYRDNKEDVIGILHAKDLLHRPGRPENLSSLEDIMRPAVFIPEQTSLGQAMLSMQDSKSEMVFIVDEYGGLEGLLTLKDLFEELVGEIEDEHNKPKETQSGRCSPRHHRCRRDRHVALSSAQVRT